MQIRLVSHDFSPRPCLRDHIERRLGSAFAPLRKRVADIAVRLRDLNHRQGGADMLCQISVSMPGQPHIVVRAVQEDMQAAIDFAIMRAAHRAVRLLGRRKPACGSIPAAC